MIIVSGLGIRIENILQWKTAKREKKTKKENGVTFFLLKDL